MSYFSVIIPVYNRAHRIEKALNSLQNQSFKDFETIVVDDASSDASFEIAKNHPLTNKIVLQNNKNSERCITRNNGIKAAKGKYICFLDSDDYHLPNHLELLYHFIQSKNEAVGFFFTNAWNEDEKGIRSKRYCPDFETHNSYTYFLRYTVNPQRWAVHKDIFKENLFDPKVNIAEDMDTSLRILSKDFPFFQLKERTTVYVAANDSFTHSDSKKWERTLDAYQKIFARELLKQKIPSKDKHYLLSMCHYYLAVKCNGEKQKKKLYQHILQAYWYKPTGYNQNSNKSLLVMSIYNLPILGNIIQNLRRKD